MSEITDLEPVYDEIYENGYETFHTFSLELIYSFVYKVVKNHINGKKMLDLGCGTGEFMRRYVTLDEPAELVGYDMSMEGIKIANSDPITKLRNIRFEKIKFDDLIYNIDNDMCEEINYYDVITSIGVIEHLDNPNDLFLIANKLLKPGGLFVVECPNFLNLRGLIWKTLEMFLGAEMSKTDKHTILPDKMFSLINNNDFKCDSIVTFDQDRGMRQRMMEDYKVRLKLALNGKVEDLDNKLKKFFDYLKFVIDGRVFADTTANGAEAIYIMRKR